MKRAFYKRTGDILEKLGVAGIALALWQEKTDMVWLAAAMLFLSYILTFLEARQ